MPDFETKASQHKHTGPETIEGSSMRVRMCSASLRHGVS